MSDYANSFREGVEEAKKVQIARKEIEDIFTDFKTQIQRLGDGKLAVALEEFIVSEGGWIHAVAFPPKKVETYTAIVAFNPSIKESPRYKIAKWKPAANGYPCLVKWGDQEHYCEDKQSLERCLEILLKDPLVAEKLLSAMTFEKPKEQPKTK